MRFLKQATYLFVFGAIVGMLFGYLRGGATPSFLAWRFSLFELGDGTLSIIGNNLAAAFVTIFGPTIASKAMRSSKGTDEALAFLYMIPTLVLFLNGFSTGFFAGKLLNNATPFLVFSSIAPHGALEIPAILLSGALGFQNAQGAQTGILSGKMIIPMVAALIIVGGYVEANVTPELEIIKEPVAIVDLRAPSSVSAGEEFKITVDIMNRGITGGDYELVISAGQAEVVAESISPRVEISSHERSMFLLFPGERNITASLIADGREISRMSSSMIVNEPNVPIEEVILPMLYAGEQVTMDIAMRNGDEINRDLDLFFVSSTGAITRNQLTLKPGERLVYHYATEMGQPGPRVFDITLVWRGMAVANRTVHANVEELRIKPVISHFEAPKLLVNKSSQIKVVLENAGTKGGEVFLLVFDSDLPQLLDSPDVTQILLTKSHLGKGIWEKRSLQLEAGEKKEIVLEITPEKPGVYNLMAFALREEVVSDAAIIKVEAN